jgi:phosphoglycerate-specific signal transduction histidine kinase
MSDISGRLSKLDDGFDVLKVLISVMAAVMLGGFAFLGTQIARLDTKIEGNTQRLNDKIDANYASLNSKIDAIPQRLAEEFRAMRAEMSAQTAAIANAVTAAKQVPPQVLLVPAPAVEAPTPKP